MLVNGTGIGCGLGPEKEKCELGENQRNMNGNIDRPKHVSIDKTKLL
jgi:hypothetical protein